MALPPGPLCLELVSESSEGDGFSICLGWVLS